MFSLNEGNLFGLAYVVVVAIAFYFVVVVRIVPVH